MLLHSFKLYEIVPILDPETYIWKSAKIIAFTTDWCLKIPWIDWSTRLQAIENPLELRPGRNRWSIRKARHSQPVMSKKRSKPLSYNPNRLQNNEPVQFWLPECDFVGHCFIDSHEKIKTGFISTNDPITHECVVEMDEMFRFIPYCYLKNSVENTHVTMRKQKTAMKLKMRGRNIGKNQNRNELEHKHRK